jgi:gliding motility-associated-like protein
MSLSQICKLLAILFFIPFLSFSQRGKDAAYTTVSALNTVVNTYTRLTANANATATSITVNNNAMSGGVFTGNLAAGDLILIIQMQGADMDINTSLANDYGAAYTTPDAHTWDGQWPLFAYEWGRIVNYNNAGKFEQVEVRSVSGTNTINLQCGLQHNYTATGKVQIVRIPRFQDLTVNSNASIVPTAWNNTNGVGGVVAIEVNGNLTLNANSRISATALGFQGGIADNVGLTGSNTASSPAGVGSTFLGSFQATQGARKGEGIGGFTVEYDAFFSRYGRGAPANGGGGGGYQNSGGGGGSNIGSGTYTGKGVPNPAYNAAWNLETAGFGGSASPGGGRGGYSYSTTNQNAAIASGAPNNPNWGGDARKINGGLGGHALVYDATRLFMGGGGGAGDQDSGQGGAGGNGGGIVMVTCYGNISGTGIIESDGAAGQKTNPNNQAPAISPTSAQRKGNDGAGGGGAGGSIYIKNSNPLPSSIGLYTRGGNGGNVDLSFYVSGSTNEGNGPGGAGAGGAIAFSSGAPTQLATGGTAGTTNSNQLTEMPVNGATDGAPGVGSLAAPTFDIIPNNLTVCAGSPITLTVSTTGTVPGTLFWYTSAFGATPITGATGTTYTPAPAPVVTTTYYVGVCPGTFRVPVTVTINPAPVISGTPVITNAGCTVPGSITGLTASGGTGTLDFNWNGISTVNGDLNNVGAGSYTLTVTDDNGCTANSGPYAITGTSGPIINTTNLVVSNELCNGTLGAISGITATGTSLTYSWSPSGGTNLNATNLTAGSYTITATDNVGCTASAGPFNVSFVPGPTVNTASVVTVDETCSLNNGTISGITASGTGLSYSWSNGGGSALDASNLNAGTYTLTVTDVNGCTASAGPYSLVDQTAPVINSTGVSVVDENCNQANGSVSGISVSGGAPELVYSWTNTSQTTLNISNLSAGTYSLTVSDQNGCTASAGPYTVLNAGGPVFDATNVVVSDVSCTGTLGSITGITATGIGLEFAWLPSGGTSLNATGLAAGSYTIAATDDNGCIAYSGPYTVETITGPTVNATALVETDESCTGSNGSLIGITATGTGLSYQWSNGGGTNLDATNLSAGTYTLTVTDGNNCAVSAGPYTLVDNSGPVINASNVIITDEHCSQGDGLIVGIAVTGGNPALIYSWDNSSETTTDLFDISAGSYTLTVTDQLGCSDIAGPFSVANIAGPSIDETNVQVQDLGCDGTAGSITDLSAIGTGTLTYAWSNSGGSAIDATGLVPGSYTLTVSDDFGCSDVTGPYVISAPVQIVIDETAMLVSQSSCTVNDGAISGITFTGGTNPTVSWSNSTGTLDINNLAPGSYTLTVSDAFGCSDQLTVDITTLNGPVIDNSNLSIVDAHCSQSNGEISGLTVSGGTPAYTYEWNNNTALNTLDLSIIPSGTYTLTVTDDAGCTDVETVVINEIAGPTIDATALNVIQPGCLSGGQITGITVVGEAPLTYSWTNSINATLDQINLNAGSYVMTVTDNFGCTETYGPVVLNEPNVPTANFTWLPASPDVNMQVDFDNTSSGNGPLSSVWTINGETFTTENTDYTFTAEGSYPVTLVITDANGCVDQVTYNVDIFGQLIIPNVVTANDDGVNDLFVIEGLKPNTTLVLFNRWGNIVLETDNYQNDWNGDDLNGFRLLDGVYTYILTPENDQPKHGFVHLVR